MTGTPRQNRCGSRISSRAQKPLEWPLCEVAERKSRCSKRGQVADGAGDYVVPLTLTQLEQALLADTLDDQPMTVAQGAPWRLSVPDKRRFINVKAVDHLELVAEPGENTALAILRARNRAQRAQNKAQPALGAI